MKSITTISNKVISEHSHFASTLQIKPDEKESCSLSLSLSLATGYQAFIPSSGQKLSLSFSAEIRSTKSYLEVRPPFLFLEPHTNLWPAYCFHRYINAHWYFSGSADQEVNVWSLFTYIHSHPLYFDVIVWYSRVIFPSLGYMNCCPSWYNRRLKNHDIVFI